MALTRNRIGLLAALTAAALVTAVVLAVTGGSGDARAATDVTAGTNTVSVSGHGSVEGVPDTLVADLEANAHQVSVQAALDRAGDAARKVISALRSAGVAHDDIQTSNLSLNTSYDRYGHVDGYDADESITVRIHPLSNVGRTLDAAATAAGNQVRVDNLSFDIADNAALLQSARTNAFADAKNAATQYATLAGRTLGSVVSIKATVTSAPTQPITFGKVLSAASPNAGVPIRPGQQKVGVTVQVVWAMR